jgi:preprotein translocase subunit SecE
MISAMEKIKLYLLESYNELVHKVTWPSWNSLMSNTVAVLVASLILTLFISIMDGGSNWMTKLIYGLSGN